MIDRVNEFQFRMKIGFFVIKQPQKYHNARAMAEKCHAGKSLHDRICHASVGWILELQRKK